jgi:hypothetical protein
MIAIALARERCNQLIQFTHQLGGGAGPMRTRSRQPSSASGGRRPKLGKEAFRKTYRYPMTDEVLRTLSMSEVAGKVKGDLGSAGVLRGQPMK